jgi:hypothetical protein
MSVGAGIILEQPMKLLLVQMRTLITKACVLQNLSRTKNQSWASDARITLAARQESA